VVGTSLVPPVVSPMGPLMVTTNCDSLCLAPALAWEGRPESSPAPGVLRCAGWRPAHERHGVTNSQASFF